MTDTAITLLSFLQNIINHNVYDYRAILYRNFIGKHNILNSVGNFMKCYNDSLDNTTPNYTTILNFLINNPNEFELLNKQLNISTCLLKLLSIYCSDLPTISNQMREINNIFINFCSNHNELTNYANMYDIPCLNGNYEKYNKELLVLDNVKDSYSYKEFPNISEKLNTIHHHNNYINNNKIQALCEIFIKKYDLFLELNEALNLNTHYKEYY
jgi:hypothetical protein